MDSIENCKSSNLCSILDSNSNISYFNYLFNVRRDKISKKGNYQLLRLLNTTLKMYLKPLEILAKPHPF